MKFIKSIKTSLLIIFICFCTFCSGYAMGSSFVYADSTTDNWTQVTTNDQLVEAFRYYCKSRDVTFNGGVADAITKFTTKTFNGICNTLGINMTALQANLKYQTDSNLGLRFLFDSQGISAYNRIFAQFLQDNDLAVGDAVNDEVVSEGKLFIDGDGNSCYIYSFASSDSQASNDTCNRVGTPYLYDISQIKSLVTSNSSSYSHVFNIRNGLSFSCTFTRSYQSYRYSYFLNISGYTGNRNVGIVDSNGTTIAKDGNVAIFETSNNNVYFGTVMNQNNGTYYHSGVSISNSNIVNANVYITTNNTTINNNTYEGDTIINNNGTTGDGGGGGGTPPTPTPDPDYTPAEDWDIDLPDLSVPNWILSGKENKFPFDIPFNVMYALSLLQAEPEAPRLEGTLDFGFYEWEYDLDLSDFDSVAEICRNMEVLAFITGLMLMTRKLIWG